MTDEFRLCDRTGCLGWEDSNLKMSFWKIPFELSEQFALFSERFTTRDFSRASCRNEKRHVLAAPAVRDFFAGHSLRTERQSFPTGLIGSD
jgi:hypothetical protein